MTLAGAGAAALAAWCFVVASVSARAVFATLLRPRGAPARTPAACPSVLVIRPCAGAEPSLARTLASSSHLRGVNPFRLVFAVAHEGDAALPVAREACEGLRAQGLDASVMLTHAQGVNQKSSQLAAAIARSARTDVVVNLDSDVDCAGLSLDAMVGALWADTSLGAVWAPPVEDGGVTFSDRCSDALLGGSLHAFPVLSALDPQGLVGKAVALRRDALDAVGGFDALTSHLGEDMELARRLRARGMRSGALSQTVTSRARGRPWRGAVDRYARWIMVIRAQRPALMASYPALFFATWPMVFSSLALALAAPAARTLALSTAAVALAARLAVALAARRASGHAMGRALADTVLADALLACAFVSALATREVRWRGRALRIDRGGLLRDAG